MKKVQLYVPGSRVSGVLKVMLSFIVIIGPYTASVDASTSGSVRKYNLMLVPELVPQVDGSLDDRTMSFAREGKLGPKKSRSITKAMGIVSLSLVTAEISKQNTVAVDWTSNTSGTE